MNYRASKVLIVSLDGATLDVLQPMMRQGLMPNLARMVDRGIASRLQSVVPPVTAPAWTSFMTGKQPGKHGIFDFTRFDEADYGWKINNSHHIRSKTIWQLLSDEGKRIIVVGLPYTYPPYPINGIMVSGWDAPFLSGAFTSPEHLSKEVLTAMPDYAENLDLPLSNNTPTKSDELFERFIRKLVRGAEQATELACRFLESEPWDVCMLHLQQTDWMQHNLWVYIEEACTNEVKKSDRVEQVRSCYKRFDLMVGTIFAHADSANTVKIVVSDHGFGRNCGSICPNYYLQKWGYLFPVTRSGESAKKVYRRFSRTFESFRALLTTGHGNKPNQKIFQSFTEAVQKTAPHERIPLDWRRTKAALVAGSETGLLYINVKGRGPLGIVEPGPEYEQVVADLIARFAEIRHPQTGEKLLREVARGVDIYPEAAEGVLLPDIVLIPSEGFTFSFEISDKPPALSTHGTHRPEGVLFLEGPELNREVAGFHPRLIDLAPTILHMLGLSVPTDMDGRVLEEIFRDSQEIRLTEMNNTMVRQNKVEYNVEETELIEQRLKGLGYIE